MGRSGEAAPRRLRPYPEYRDAGIEWLGTIPSHWRTSRLRFVVETNSTKENVRHLDPHTEVSFVPMETVREYGGIDLSSVKPLADVIDGYTYFRDGDVILAAFLDRETAKIDELVERKERLIELLLEKRSALITRAVTRGLDLDVSMEDSGVEWLGDVPAHWDVKRVKWVARMESGHTPDKKVEDYWDGDVPWVSLNDTHHLRDHDFIADTAYYTNERGLENSSARLLPPRSVIFSRDATIGLCAITERAMAVSQHFIAWLCGNDISPEYLVRVFDAMQDELQRLTAGATLRTIGMSDVRTLSTPVPPVDEQRTIVQHIQQECLEVDQATAKIRHAIALLNESRTALISAAVTGKIDVRDATT